jgi:uncharacterized protein YuzE
MNKKELQFLISEKDTEVNRDISTKDDILTINPTSSVMVGCKLILDKTKGDVIISVDEDGDIAVILFWSEDENAEDASEDFLQISRSDLLPGLYYAKLKFTDEGKELEEYYWEIQESEPIFQIENSAHIDNKTKEKNWDDCMKKYQGQVGFYDIDEFKI